MSKSVSKLRAARKTSQKNVNTDEVFKSNFERPDLENIVLDEELRSFIPALKTEERNLLEDSIRKEGVRDALLVWKSEDRGYVLVDGYNRLHTLRKLFQEGHTAKYSIKILEFEDREAVKDWMIINQLGRRNLTDEQRSYLRGLRYQREKERHGGERRASDQNDHLKTSARLASEYKVGEATIRRDNEYALGLEKVGSYNPALKKAILDGDLRISKSVIQKLSKANDAPAEPFQDASDILDFVTAEKPTLKKPSDAFSETRDLMILRMKKLTQHSSVRDVQQLRTMLDKLEQMLKN